MFNTSKPIIRFKQHDLDIQDLCGLLRIRGRLGKRTLFHRFYTRIDQVFLVWGLITAAIFATAHFAHWSWQFQSILWSAFTIIGSIAMACLTDFWVKIENLRWIVYLWLGLMGVGLGLTNLGVFGGVGLILINLCPLWLGMIAIGYIVMGWGMCSRAFILCGILHLLAICLIPYTIGWQFLFTGVVISGCLLLLAEVQWDMRSPVQSEALTTTELQFNLRQQQLRQSKEFKHE